MSLSNTQLALITKARIITVGHDTVTVRRGREENILLESDEIPEDVD